MKSKLEKLKKILASMEKVLIAYSGGVDSTFLLKMAKDVLDNKLIAVTAESLTFPSREIKFAQKMAKKLKVRHIVIKTDELKNKNFIKNNRDRCYWCKRELFLKLKKIARKENLKYMIEASNYDDRNDFRPGLKAIQELGIRSPLMEAKLTKREIRQISKSFKLDTWNKPSFACLASRIPYGTEITEGILKRINKAEEILISQGFKQVRVRDHSGFARIEVGKNEIDRFINNGLRETVVRKLKNLGYQFVTIDLEGYRTGSMNLSGGDSR